jgi:ribosome maturation factor RimP
MMPTWPLEQIQRLLEPTLSHMGYSIYALQQTGGGGRTLRIMIDKEDGFVSLDDCARVSQVVSPLLDQADLIPDSYTLEVSSPGAERELRDRAEYQRFLGRTINLRYRTGGEAEVVLEGKLATVDEDGIVVMGRRGHAARVDWDEVITGRLVASL